MQIKNYSFGTASDYVRAVHQYIKINLGQKFRYEEEIVINAEDLKNYLCSLPHLVKSTLNNQSGVGTIEANLQSLSTRKHPISNLNGKELWEYDGITLKPTENFKDAVFQLI